MINLSMVVLRSLMTRAGWDLFHNQIKVDSFENNEFRRIFQHIERAHGETDGDITPDMLRADMTAQYTKKLTVLEEMGLVLDRLEKTNVLPLDFMQSIVQRFLERQVGYELLEWISTNVDKQEFSMAAVEEFIEKSVGLSGRAGQDLVSLFEAPLPGATDNRRTAYSLGCSTKLDAGLRGGVGHGELGLYLAGPSVGKTAYLCWFGAKQVEARRNALHITLEINTRKVLERYYQSWTNRASTFFETPKGQEEVQAAKERIQASGGHVWVVDWAYQRVSSQDIGALIKKMDRMKCACHNEPMKVDVLIIDYLELMSPNRFPGKEMRQSYSAIGREARQLARNLDIPVMSAWQVNRAGHDKMLLSQADASESWDIIKISDIILGLNQSSEELNNRRMRINIVKQRESTNRGVYELYSDLDHMIIRDVTPKDMLGGIVNVVLGKEEKGGSQSGRDGSSQAAD